MRKSKVSIIIPIYNVDKFLKRCLNSVSCQDYSNIEVLLIDDGSTDKSGKICEYFSKTDKRFKTIHQKNSGVSAARNTGIAASSGDYICFVDGDDLIEPFYVSTLVKSLENNKSDIAVGTSYNYGFRNKVRVTLVERNIKFSNNNSNEDCKALISSYMLTPWCKIFKKSIIKKHNLAFPVGIGYGEDSIFVYNYLQYADSLYLINKNIYRYNSLLSSASRKYWDDMSYYCYLILSNFEKVIKLKFNLNDETKTKILGDYALNLLNISIEHYSLYCDEQKAIHKFEEAYSYFSDYLEPLFNLENDNKYSPFISKDWKLLYNTTIRKKTKNKACFQRIYKYFWSKLYKLGLS